MLICNPAAPLCYAAASSERGSVPLCHPAKRDRHRSTDEPVAPAILSARTVVVKLGTQLLSDKEGRLDAAFVARIARAGRGAAQRRMQVTIVSSGAIGAGLRELNLPKRPDRPRQAPGRRGGGAAAADGRVGRRRSSRTGCPSRRSCSRARTSTTARASSTSATRSTPSTSSAAVPIINENDTISTDELVKISFGDNDILAALVTHALRADLLVLLTVVDGILDAAGQARAARRERRGGARARARREVGAGQGRDELQARGGADGHRLRRGDDRRQRPRPSTCCTQILDGEDVGTLFVPAGRKMSSPQPLDRQRPAGGHDRRRRRRRQGRRREEPQPAAGGDREGGRRLRARATWSRSTPPTGGCSPGACRNYAAADVGTHPREEDRRGPIPSARSGVRRGRAPGQPGRLRTAPPSGTRPPTHRFSSVSGPAVCSFLRHGPIIVPLFPRNGTSNRVVV